MKVTTGEDVIRKNEGGGGPEKKVYLQVTYFYADTRANAPSSFVGEAFLIDEAAKGNYIERYDNTADSIVPCDGGAHITVRPGWLWREVVRVSRKPVELHVEPTVA